jgi:hypothetical protein
MRNLRSRNSAKDWAKLAVRLGRLFTAPKIRASIADEWKERTGDVTDAIASRYEDPVDRLEAAASALRRRTYWPSRTVGFLVGVGVGAGLGILLAPASGSETREAIRGKAADMKNRVVESASTEAGKFRQSMSSMPSTGTEG